MSNIEVCAPLPLKKNSQMLALPKIQAHSIISLSFFVCLERASHVSQTDLQLDVVARDALGPPISCSPHLVSVVLR